MFYYLCSVMHRIFLIVLFLLGGLLFEKGDFAPTQNLAKFEFSDRHNVQLECCHRYNIDAERTSTIVVPSARTAQTTSSRQAQQRILNFVVAERFATTNYPTTIFIHRLGNLPRAVDFYLYMLCQLRL